MRRPLAGTRTALSNATPQTSSRAMTGDVARLEIGEIFLDDVGEYACVARNELGEDRTACQITVTACDSETSVVPMFLTKFTKTVIKVGDKLILECDVIGSPEPDISWTKNGRPLRDDCPYNQMYDGRTAKLEIEDVTSDDSGRYECIAGNEAGRVSLDASVAVQVKDKPPCVTVPLCDVYSKAGESATLTCHIVGIPQPSIQWRKNGMMIGHTKDFKQTYDGSCVTLDICGVCHQDSGRYECVAHSKLGETSTTCLLTVKDTATGKESALSPAPPITRSVTPPQTITGLARSASTSQRSSHGPLHLSSPTGPTASHNISSSSVGQTSSKTSTNVVSPLVSPSALPTHIIGKALTRSASMTISTVVSSATPVMASPSSPVPADISGNAITLSSSKMSTNLASASTTLTRSASQRSVTVISSSPESSPSSPLSSHVLGKAITRSASQIVTSSSQSSSSPPQSIIGKALETLAAKSPSRHQNVSRSMSSPTNTQVETSTKPPTGPVDDPSLIKRNIPSTESISVPARSNPLNTIGKFLAMSAAKDLQPSFPIRTTLDSPTEGGPVPVSPTQPQEKGPIQKAPSPSTSQTQPLSKVQQLRLQFLGEAGQTQTNKVSSAPIRRWHSLPPQDLKPVIVKKEKGSVTRTKQLHVGTDSREATMPTYENINDEEELMKIMSKTDDFDERKKIRARLKEVREKDKLEREARRQQREKESDDVVKKRFEKAEEDKKRKMQQFSDMAAKPTSVTTTRTGGDGSQITTTTTTSTSTQKVDGGGTRTQTVKKTETMVSKTSGMGGVQFSKPGAEAMRKLSDQLQTASPPGTSGRLMVKTESWNSADAVVHTSEKTESWGAKPGGSRGAMAAFKQMDATNSPAQPNALVTVSLAKKAATTMRRNAIAIKQEVLAFCKHNTKEYKTIQITNFSSCWNNGLAFCALIHHFFPDAFDFNALTPKNRRYNFDLAFDTAEKRADIAPLLDTDDMVRMKNPDWKCVFTYVQSIYRHLRDHDANKAKEAEQ
ncbi:smoothelin-like isoform X2 [Haliotis rubra]|uniref:smoothelin-like isoform X2 n=1 Tax=Haliotis rubra TaxID=36100 RepID=UPI001EE5BC1C|nr:smoothelin-like isoform X2 [Haliotis rubra]